MHVLPINYKHEQINKVFNEGMTPNFHVLNIKYCVNSKKTKALRTLLTINN